MRKQNNEITDQGIIAGILQNARICRLAMIDGDKPYLLPFNYGYTDNCLYIHCAPEGRKLDVLRRNNLVCFEVEENTATITADTACKWSTLYRSVVGYGLVDIITDDDEKRRGLDCIMKQHGYEGKPEYTSAQVQAILVLKLTITQLSAKQSSNWNRLHPEEATEG